MKKLGNFEVELKKIVAYKKSVYLIYKKSVIEEIIVAVIKYSWFLFSKRLLWLFRKRRRAQF